MGSYDFQWTCEQSQLLDDDARNYTSNMPPYGQQYPEGSIGYEAAKYMANQMRDPFLGHEEYYGSHLQDTSYNTWGGMNYNYDFYDPPNFSFLQIDNTDGMSLNEYCARYNEYCEYWRRYDEYWMNLTHEDVINEVMSLPLHPAINPLSKCLQQHPQPHVEEIDQIKEKLKVEAKEDDKNEELKTEPMEEQPPNLDEFSYIMPKEVLKEQASEDGTWKIEKIMLTLESESFFPEEPKSWSKYKFPPSSSQLTCPMFKFHLVLKKIKNGWLGQRDVGKLFQCNSG